VNPINRNVSHSGPAVLVRGLTKMYGVLRALDSITFEVQHGEVFAILGPNGAGKTTTIEILEGLRQADGGRVEVLGERPGPRAPQLKTRVGAMPQDAGLYPGISPRGALELFATFYERARRKLRLTDSAEIPPAWRDGSTDGPGAEATSQALPQPLAPQAAAPHAPTPHAPTPQTPAPPVPAPPAAPFGAPFAVPDEEGEVPFGGVPPAEEPSSTGFGWSWEPPENPDETEPR